MTPNQIELVRETWKQVIPIADTAAQMFYQRLFEIDPGSRRLFAHTNMTQQRDRLAEALGFVVDNAGQLEQLTPVLAELGRRHAQYGVEYNHYDSVGVALIWTLEQGLGAAFTAEVRDAWTSIYTFVADVMRNAASEVVARDTSETKVSWMTSIRIRLARAAVAACLALSVAAGMTAVTAPMLATPVGAFGLGDIAKGIKKVGGKVKDGAKRVGKDAKNSAMIVGGKVKKIGKGAASNAKDFGSALKRDAKKIGGRIKNTGKTYVEIGKAVGGGIKDALDGTEFKPPTVGPEPKPGPIVIRDPFHPTPIWTGPIPGIRPAAGAVDSGNKSAVARDKSVMGRPVGSGKQPIATEEAKAPAKGITKRELQTRQKSRRIIRDHRRSRNAKRIIRDHRSGRKARRIIRSHRKTDVRRRDHRSRDRQLSSQRRKRSIERRHRR